MRFPTIFPTANDSQRSLVPRLYVLCQGSSIKHIRQTPKFVNPLVPKVGNHIEVAEALVHQPIEWGCVFLNPRRSQFFQHFDVRSLSCAPAFDTLHHGHRWKLLPSSPTLRDVSHQAQCHRRRHTDPPDFHNISKAACKENRCRAAATHPPKTRAVDLHSVQCVQSPVAFSNDLTS